MTIPQVCGFASGALGPPLMWTCSSLKGNCGLLANVAVSWPEAGSAETVPRSFDQHPGALRLNEQPQHPAFVRVCRRARTAFRAAEKHLPFKRFGEQRRDDVHRAAI